MAESTVSEPSFSTSESNIERDVDCQMGSDGGSLSEEEEIRLEKEHFEKIVNAMLYYKYEFNMQYTWAVYNLGTTLDGRSYARGKLHRLYTDFTKLPRPHQLLLPRFPAHMKECIKAVEVNSKFLGSIVENAVGFFQNSEVSEFVSAVQFST